MKTYIVHITWHNRADSRMVLGYDARCAKNTVKMWCPGARITSCHEYAPPGSRGSVEFDILSITARITQFVYIRLHMNRG